ncbi:MAG: hypothetical protein M4579_003652 [Chaenotheca gracillima]|nr:MAG: hypothetical protein M4579_003652 [Chaenotheca gracillima]
MSRYADARAKAFEKTSAPQQPKIILFGDSLTERAFGTESHGFGAVLQNRYAQKAEVQNWAHVPLAKFEANIRHYVDMVLTEPATEGTKVILITPPPIGIKTAQINESTDPSIVQVLTKQLMEKRGYETYINKKVYAEKIMQIAEEYEEETTLVAGLDFWKAMIELADKRTIGTGKLARGRTLTGEGEEIVKLLPGTGLPGAEQFGDRVFLDGLHLGPDGYDVLSQVLLSLINTKWPELRSDRLPQQVGSQPSPETPQVDNDNT